MAFQILSLSGGGYLGLFTVAVLAKVEEQTGRRTADMFDLFAGTSIGGIIALGLSAGVSAADIRDAFIQNGPSIFGHRVPDRGIRKFFSTAGNLKRPRHSAKSLRATVKGIIGADKLMKDLLRPTIVPAVSLTKGGPKVFKTGHHPRFILDWRLGIVDVAMATSAAPTYFPTHRIGEDLFADGGMFANSPDLLALHEAELFLGVNISDVSVLSIGTTTTSFAFSGGTSTSMGLLDWVESERLTSAIIGSQQAITNDMMRHRLGGRYVRIDRAQADHQRRDLALDCASPSARRTLLSMADSAFAEISADENLRTMISHTAVDRPFVNASL